MCIARRFLSGLLLVLGMNDPARAQDAAEIVRQAEQTRIETIARVAPSVVSIHDAQQRGGGSGVVLEPSGLGVTNYHVVAGMLETCRGYGGLSDGNLYELEVLGIDPIGDLAMFRLSGRESFPFSTLGDSDAVQVGDAAIAMGNPFVLSEDHTPSVSLGIVTGVHRYQWGVGGNLIYSDCIQTDTAINPGNSGGPLFNNAGEVIGINGRISVNTRGRFNVGFGYAIAANQVRRFIPLLRAGLVATHGTLQATVDETSFGALEFAQVVPGGAADLAGIRTGDRLIALDGVDITSPNHLASLIGTYPGDWHVIVDFKRGETTRRAAVQLDPVAPKLRKPFAPNRETNLEEVRRVLRAFQSAIGTPEVKPAARLEWTVRRTHAADRDSAVKPQDCFLASQYDGGPVRWQQIGGDGALGRLIEFDARRAVQQTRAGGEAFEFTVDVSMILSALHFVHNDLTIVPADELDLTNAAYVGGDQLARADELPGCAEEAEFSEALDVLEWQLPGGAVGRLAFDATTGLLRRIQLRDRPSGLRAAIYLHDYQEVGGCLRATTIEIHGPNYGWCDSLSDWEVIP